MSWRAARSSPLTGFYRTGCCDTGPEDLGVHTVCAQVTEEFLAFSQARGNDLSTPNPDFGFSGLSPGDRWCLCASRWLEAWEAGVAPPVFLAGTHEATLAVMPIELLLDRLTDVTARSRPTWHRRPSRRFASPSTSDATEDGVPFAARTWRESIPRDLL